MKQFLLSIFLIFITGMSFAQSGGVKGNVRGADGESFPYASVFCEELKKGTTSNVEGKYQLDLPPGDYTIQYQYLGFETKKVKLQVGTGWVDQDIQLSERQYKIHEVKISATGEDPAYYIMRKAIGMSQYYLNQVSAYDCEVYFKGIQK